MPLNEELINANPWTGTSFHSPQSTGDIYLPLIKDQFDEDRWYYANDDDIKVLKQCVGNAQEGASPDMKKFFFNLDPQPWIGRWNVERKEELPEIVILSLNPGIGDSNFLDIECESIDKAMDNGRKYYNLMTRLFSGEAATSEIILDPIWQHYNGSYWLEKLFPLIEEIEERKIEKTDLLYLKKYSDRLKSMFDRIMFIDLCPYHSLNASALGTLVKRNETKFKSMGFTKKLVEMFIKQNRKIVIARARTLWEELVPSLKCNETTYRLRSRQNVTFSDKNCCKSNGDGENVFNEILNLLKDISETK